MKKQSILIAALLGALVFLGGCNKNSFSGKGGEITFGTSADGVLTRTEFGDYNDARNHQAINWLEGDQIRIVSDNAAVYNDGSDKHFADYKVTGVTNTAGGGISTATIANVAANGLAWKAGYNGEYAFYAVYPSSIFIGDGQNNGTTLGEVTATIPENQAPLATTSMKYIKVVDNKIQELPSSEGAEYTYTVYAPDMTGAVMTAAATGVSENANAPQVKLGFKPAFTAIEINLTSGDADGFSVSEVSLSAGEEEGNADYLSGVFTMTAGNLSTAEADVDGNNATKSVTVKPSSAFDITATQGATITLLTLPVTNQKTLTLTVKTSAGTAKLPLNQGGSAYQFEAGKKYNINFLKLGGKFSYAINLSGLVLPWIYSEEKTIFSQNVQAKAFDITGALEDDDTVYPKNNHYEAFDMDANNEFKTYAEWVDLGKDGQVAYNAAHKNYYQQYYQLRYLRTQGIQKPHFVVKFTPIAPLAGYWNLSAEAAPSFGNTSQGGPEGFTIYRWDGESELNDWSFGQIMNMEVELHIYPSAQRDPSKEYCMLIKAFFSPNRNGEPTYSADSEMQDVHGDGRYSYWKFVIPATE